MSTPFTLFSGTDYSVLASSLLAPNSGVSVISSSLTLSPSGSDAVNLYDGSLTTLGIGAGLLLTTGTMPSLTNTVEWYGQDNSATSGVLYNGDAEIDAVVNAVFQTQSYDATALSFDFTVSDSTATSVSFDLVFGSDEYPEWVDQFVDCAIVTVNGVNYALFNHDPMHPLSVVSSNLAAGYFQDNAADLITGVSPLPIEYDGVSHVLKIVAPIITGGATNHIKIGIADTGDHIYDSGMFIANFAAGTIPGSGVVTTITGDCTESNDVVTGSTQDEYFDLKAGSDTLYAGAGDDIVVAGQGNDVVYGGSGNDEMMGGGGDDSFDGGDGTADTAVYSGASTAYGVEYVGADNSIVITDSLSGSTSEGKDTLKNIEQIKFSDGLFALETGGLSLVSDPGVIPPPSNMPGIVVVSGVGSAGHTLTATVSDPDGIDGDNMTYQWQRSTDEGASWAVIADATDKKYLLLDGDVGHLIQVVANYTDNGAQPETPVSFPKAILPAQEGDALITLIHLNAPSGSIIINPLTTLLKDALDLGISPNIASQAIKTVLGIPSDVQLQSYDAYEVLLSDPQDAVALTVEKVAVQIAILTSLSDDDTGMNLTLAILDAAAANTTYDLGELNDICAILGLDPSGNLPESVNIIVDRNSSITSDLNDGGDVTDIEKEWVDFCSNQDDVASTSIADLSIHINQSPQGSAIFVLPEAVQDQDYLITSSDLLQGFTDPDGDALVVAFLTSDAGSVQDNADGTWLFTPVAGYTGPVELTYTVSDGQGGSIEVSQLLVVAPAAIEFIPAEHHYSWYANTIQGTQYADSIDADALAAAHPYNGPITVSFAFGWNQSSYILGENEVGNNGSVTFTAEQLLELTNIGLELKHGDTVVTTALTVAVTDILQQVGGTYAIHWIGTAEQPNVPTIQLPVSLTLLAINSYKDVIYSDDAPDSIMAGAGDDYIHAAGGNDTIDGGFGRDTVGYYGNKSDYDISALDSNGQLTVTDINLANGDDGTDTLKNVERLEFAGGDVELLMVSFSPAIQRGDYGQNSIVGTAGDDGIDANALGTAYETASQMTLLTNRDWIDGGEGNDAIDGGVGGDDIKGGAGNDVIDGGAETLVEQLQTALYHESRVLENIALYNALPAGLSITPNSNGSFTVTDTDLSDGDEGSDTLTNMTALQFSDWTGHNLTTRYALHWEPVNNIESEQPSAMQVVSASAQGSDYNDVIGLSPVLQGIADVYQFTGGDYLVANGGDDTMYGGSGGDWLDGGSGDDFLQGNNDGDALTGGTGNDTIDGGDNSYLSRLFISNVGAAYWQLENRVYYTGLAKKYTITEVVAQADDQHHIAEGQRYYMVEDTRSGSPDGTDVVYNVDVLQFSDKVFRLSPELWFNTTSEENSQVILYNIHLDGTAYADVLGYVTGETIPSGSYNFSGDDYFTAGAGNDTVHGGGGYDVAAFSGAFSRYTVTFKDKDGAVVGGYDPNGSISISDKKGSDGSDTLTGIETLRFADGEKNLTVIPYGNATDGYTYNGSEYDDAITGTDVHNTVHANSGNDTIVTGSANDWIAGGAGDDSIVAGAGADWIEGGYGNDTIDGGANGELVYADENNGDVVHYNAPIRRFDIVQNSNGTYSVIDHLGAEFGGFGSDTLSNVEQLVFSDAQFNLAVQFYSYGIVGTEFDDVVDAEAFLVAYGGSSYNSINAKGGDDVVFAGSGGDWIVDDAGNDVYDGGADGTDGEVWQQQDVVAFSGTQSRYVVDEVGFDELADAIKTKIGIKYSSIALPSTVVRITDKVPDSSGGEGTNYVINVERLHFQDGAVDLVLHYTHAASADSYNVISGSYLSDTIDANALDNDNTPQGQVPMSYHDQISGGVGNDVLYAGDDGDVLFGAQGNDTLDGGANGAVVAYDSYDRAIFTYSINRYDIAFYRQALFADLALPHYNENGVADVWGNYVASEYYTDNGVIVVQDRYDATHGGEGRDVLHNIEMLQFSDAWETLHIEPQNGFVSGSRFGDKIDVSTSSSSYQLWGNDGNDWLIGGDGADHLYGSVGNDTLDGGGNPNTGNSWSDYDVAYFDANVNEFKLTKESNGSITVTHLIPTLFGGVGSDTVMNVERLQFNDRSELLEVTTANINGVLYFTGTLFADSITGTDADDFISGNNGDDTLDGGSGNDNLNAGAGNDVLIGGDGDDTFVFLSSGNDSIDGGAGSDKVEYEDAVARYTIELVRGGTTLATFDQTGGFGAQIVQAGDTLTITDRLDDEHGGEGVDTLSNVETIRFSNGVLDVVAGTFTEEQHTPQTNTTGTEENDTLFAGAGNDAFSGGAGDDVVQYFGAPRDRFEIFNLGNGMFTAIDIASVNNPEFLPDGHLNPTSYSEVGEISDKIGYGMDTLAEVEKIHFSDMVFDLIPQESDYYNGKNIAGTSFNDTLQGTAFGDWIDGRAGNDTIDGSVEATNDSWEMQDIVHYSGARERYIVKGVRVVMSGSPGSQTYTIVNNNSPFATVFGVQVTDILSLRDTTFTNGSFNLNPDNISSIVGTGQDLLVNVERLDFNGEHVALSPEVWVSDGNISLTGTEFDDVLNGGDGNDWLRGNAGNDMLFGGTGGDNLEGGAGHDSLDGGENGADSWQTDTAYYNASFERFMIEQLYVDNNFNVVQSSDSGAIAAYRISDILSSTDPLSLGTDIVVNIEYLSFNDRWIALMLNRSSWIDWQGVTSVNVSGTIFNDIINEQASELHTYINGGEGNDVLLGGTNGDTLHGGAGNDLLDGGAHNGSAYDVAEFSGSQSRYSWVKVTTTGDATNGTVSINGEHVATVTNNELLPDVTVFVETLSVLHLALVNGKLFNNGVGYLVTDSLSAELGGEGTDLAFGVEALCFNDGCFELTVRADAWDWDGNGTLDAVSVIGTGDNDSLTLAALANLTNSTVDELEKIRVDSELKGGDDIYIGGNGADSIRPGAGNDYVDAGGNSVTDQWGNVVRDEVHFEGAFSRYIVEDVALVKQSDTGIWAISSEHDTLTLTNNSTLTSTNATELQLDGAGIQQIVQAMIAHAGAATELHGWLVIDKLPTSMDGSGVDAVVGAEVLSFSDYWMPLTVDIYYHRDDAHNIISASIRGTDNSDTIQANGEYDFSGNDWIEGNGGNDSILAGAGGDYIIGGAGNDTIDGGANGTADATGYTPTDIALYAGNVDRYLISAGSDEHGVSYVTVQDLESEASDGTDTLYNIEQLAFSDRWVRLSVEHYSWNNGEQEVMGVAYYGSMLSDHIDVSDDEYVEVPHEVYGMEGNDTLVGSTAPDNFRGGSGDDEIIGGENGEDQFGNPGNDVAYYDGMSSRYTITILDPGTKVTLNGHEYTAGADGAIVQVVDSMSDDDGGNGTDTLIGIEALSFWNTWIPLQVITTYTDVTGDGHADEAYQRGTDSADTINGETINDRIDAGAGNDTITGGTGADIITGGAGDDNIDGGTNGTDVWGNPMGDVALYEGSYANYTMTQHLDGIVVINDTRTGSNNQSGTDTLINIESVQFRDCVIALQPMLEVKDFNDDGTIDQIVVRGSDLFGDVLAPTESNSTVSHKFEGLAGDDTITGGSGNDLFDGGAGNDVMSGGDGYDKVLFNGNAADYNYILPEYVDTLFTLSGADGIDTLSGIEELVFADQVVKIVAQVTSTTFDTDGDSTIDQVLWSGTDGNDTIIGAADANNIIESGDGNDVLMGAHRADSFKPGRGNDVIDGAANVGVDAHGHQAMDVVEFSGKIEDYTVATIQESSFTVSGTVEIGDIYSAVIAGTTATYTAQTDDTVATVATQFAAALQNAVHAGQSSTDMLDFTATAMDATITMKGVDMLFAVTPSVTNGTHLSADASGITVAGANQSGSSLTVNSITGIASGDYVSYMVSPASGMQMSYGAYKIIAINGTTLVLDGMLGASPADGATVTITADNSDNSAAVSTVTYDRYVTVTEDASGETDTLRNIEKLVFENKSVQLAPEQSSKATHDGSEVVITTTIKGTAHSDVLYGTDGNDIFKGEGQHDNDYIVLTDHSGVDQVRGFAVGDHGDVLVFLLGADDTDGFNGTGVDSVAELMAHTVQQGNDTFVDLGEGNSILLTGVVSNTLTDANVAFISSDSF